VDISQSSFSRISGLEESTGVEEERYLQQLRSLAMMWEMSVTTTEKKNIDTYIAILGEGNTSD
jgi:hypothetical protein